MLEELLFEVKPPKLILVRKKLRSKIDMRLLHPKCTVIVDEAAAKELQGKDYYHWIFANEPEWQQYQDCLKD